MDVAIIYDSQTGNTQELAEAIKSSLKQEPIYFGTVPKKPLKADLYFIGSWTLKGDCTPKIQSFLQSLEQESIAYFATSGYGGSAAYFDTLFKRVKKQISESNRVVDYFYCQGKMPLSVRDRYVKMMTANPEDASLKASIENFDRALTHPDENDLLAVKAWAEEVIKKL